MRHTGAKRCEIAAIVQPAGGPPRPVFFLSPSYIRVRDCDTMSQEGRRASPAQNGETQHLPGVSPPPPCPLQEGSADPPPVLTIPAMGLHDQTERVDFREQRLLAQGQQPVRSPARFQPRQSKLLEASSEVHPSPGSLCDQWSCMFPICDVTHSRFKVTSS